MVDKICMHHKTHYWIKWTTCYYGNGFVGDVTNGCVHTDLIIYASGPRNQLRWSMAPLEVPDCHVLPLSEYIICIFDEKIYQNLIPFKSLGNFNVRKDSVKLIDLI